MTNTASTAFSAAIGFTVQKMVLPNLRDTLIWADSQEAQEGTFDPQSDMIMFVAIPDLSTTTPQTPLTEGSPPTARALTMTAVNFSTAQYGDLVSVTDVAKVKGPEGLINTATERVTRTSKVVIDTITRDTIFAGGTAFYWAASHSTRATLDSSDKATGLLTTKLYGKMKKAKIPTYPDGTYSLTIGPATAYDLKVETTASSAWREVSKYTTEGANKINAQALGRFNGFNVFETNTAPTFSSGVTVEAGIAHGPIRGWGTGSLQTLQTFHVAPGGDHTDPLAQLEYVGWKVNFGVGVLSNSYYYRVEGYGSSI